MALLLLCQVQCRYAAALALQLSLFLSPHEFFIWLQGEMSAKAE